MTRERSQDFQVSQATLEHCMANLLDSVAIFNSLLLIKRDPEAQVRDSLLYTPRVAARVPVRDKSPFSPAGLKLEESMYLKHQLPDMARPNRLQRHAPLLAKRANLAPPPALEVARRNVDPQVPQCLCTQVTVVRALDTGIWIIPLGVGLDALSRQAHNFPEQLDDLVLCHAIFARELEDMGKTSSISSCSVEILDRDI